MELNPNDIIEAFKRMFPMQYDLAVAQVVIDVQAAEIENLKAENEQLMGAGDDKPTDG